MTGLEVGSEAPDFTLKDQDGQPVTLVFADAIGEILTAGPIEGVPPLPFKFYI